MKLKALTMAALISASLVGTAEACTSFVLNAEDGAVVYGRTMEWGAFDLQSRLSIAPRGHAYSGVMPDGSSAMTFENKYGFVSIDAIKKDIATDGMNEKGLVVGVLYHPGTAEYNEVDLNQADKTVSSQMLANYILGQFETVEQVAEGLKDIRVIELAEAAFGGHPIPLHWTVVDANNNRIVVEYLDGELKVFENKIGVMTNSPSFDWHQNNLRNYVHLTTESRSKVTIEGVDITPTGAGTEFLGLPGDYTPPSRFIRAVAFTQKARTTEDGADAVLESFRILDNFNLPIGSAEGGAASEEYLKVAKSSTMWTSTADATNLKYYFHTQYDRRIKMIDLNEVDFSATNDGIVYIPLDSSREQPIQNMTPRS